MRERAGSERVALRRVPPSSDLWHVTALARDLSAASFDHLSESRLVHKNVVHKAKGTSEGQSTKSSDTRTKVSLHFPASSRS